MRLLLTLTLAINYSLFASEAELGVNSGSGFFITTDGYFVTNNHVVDEADSVAVKFENKIIPASVIKTDANNDIAILKLEGTYPCLPIGEGLEIRPGEDVFTIGFPKSYVMGDAPKTTLGTVSAITGKEDDPRMFQISVQIQPGNSGGPLVLKSNGNVIGVTSSSLGLTTSSETDTTTPQNVNYAMKSTYIRPLLTTIPGLVEKLPALHTGDRPWKDVQKEVEKCVGLVVIYQPDRNDKTEAVAETPLDQSKALLGKLMVNMEKLVVALEAVTDKATAETAATKIKEIGAEMRTLAPQAKELKDKLTEEEKKTMKTASEEAMKPIQERMEKVMGKAMADSEVAAILMPAMMEFGKSLQADGAE